MRCKVKQKRDADITALVFDRTLPWIHNDIHYLHQVLVTASTIDSLVCAVAAAPTYGLDVA